MNCKDCIHDTAARIAGEDREHLTPCWGCGDYHRNFVNKYCSTCKFRAMNDEITPCAECGTAYRMYQEGDSKDEDETA